MPDVWFWWGRVGQDALRPTLPWVDRAEHRGRPATSPLARIAGVASGRH